MLFTDVIATLFTQVLQVSSTRPELGASALSGRAASGAFEAFSPYLNNMLLLFIIGAKVLQKNEFHKSERKFFALPYFFGTKVSQVWSS